MWKRAVVGGALVVGATAGGYGVAMAATNSETPSTTTPPSTNPSTPPQQGNGGSGSQGGHMQGNCPGMGNNGGSNGTSTNGGATANNVGVYGGFHHHRGYDSNPGSGSDSSSSVTRV